MKETNTKFNKLIEEYEKERQKWIEAGKPLRSSEEIKQIHNICSKCVHFKPKNKKKGTCTLCGCSIKKKGNLLNKAAWGTTECPDNPPRWPVEHNEE